MNEIQLFQWQNFVKILNQAAQRCCQRLANIAISWFNDLAAVVENEAGKLCLGLRWFLEAADLCFLLICEQADKRKLLKRIPSCLPGTLDNHDHNTKVRLAGLMYCCLSMQWNPIQWYIGEMMRRRLPLLSWWRICCRCTFSCIRAVKSVTPEKVNWQKIHKKHALSLYIKCLQ